MSDPLLQLSRIQKIYDRGGQKLEVLKGVDLEIYDGESLSIVGASGAGKSTLLHILGTLDRPTFGKVYFKGQELNQRNDDELAVFRGRELGFIFQFHHLLSEFSAVENVMLPMQLAGLANSEARSRALELLEMVGLTQRCDHYPSEMSGGEQQRVAVARALVQKPKIVLADEPTGNLDTQNGRLVQDLLFQFKNKLGFALVVVTHDQNFAGRFTRRLSMKDGQWN